MASDLTDTLVRWVTENYLATGSDVTVKEIAHGLGWPESKVRKVMDAEHGCPQDLQACQEVRPSYSKGYSGFKTGEHRVWVYSPRKATLRHHLVALLAAVRAADDMAGKTTVKPAGQPWRDVFAIPEGLWESVRQVLSDATAEQTTSPARATESPLPSETASPTVGSTIPNG